MFPTDAAKKRKAPRTTYSRKAVPTAREDHRAKRRSTTNVPAVASPSPRPPPDLARLEPESKSTTPPPQTSPAPDGTPGKKEEKKTFIGFTRTAALPPVRRRTPGTASTAPKLTQLTIDLGQPLRTTCRECGMSYYPSSHDDDQLHRRFHAKSVGGVDFTPSVVNRKASARVVWRGGEAYVLVVDRKSSAVERKKAREVLEVVDLELSAAGIEEGVLWGGGGGGRFKVLLYVLGKKCVGLCLVERIRKAYRVIGDEDGETAGEKKGVVHRGSSITVSDESQPAVLGISRIWVCASNRRQGIAGRLLDCARHHFIYGMEVGKEMVAFSQPTESGGALARGWFGLGGEGGGKEGRQHWAVYVEEP